MKSPFLHDRQNFKDLLELTAVAQNIKDVSLVEKDYWLMHVLWGLQQLKLDFHLKGGTSLSKGYHCVHRFSEDIDLKIEPNEQLCGFKVYSGKNHDDPKQRDSRLKYFNWIHDRLHENIPGITEVIRDESFDDKVKNRNGGIRLIYPTLFTALHGLKEGILLEVGFDRTTPNRPCLISSWAYDHAIGTNGVSIVDNRAINVLCYEPKYTFVEKLHAVVRKFRLYKEGKQGANLPKNFIRHYYDLYQLIELPEIQAFIGTENYKAHKSDRFGTTDPKIVNSDAFKLLDPIDRAVFEKEYLRTESLYYKGRPTLTQILDRIGKDVDRL